MEDPSTLSPEARAFLEREVQGKIMATMSVISTERFHGQPTRIGDDILLGYLWSIEKDGVSQAVAKVQLEERMNTAVAKMRPRLFQCKDMTPDRIGVMLHVALAIGIQRVLEMDTVWQAIRIEDYDLAADELLLSEWATMHGDSDFSRRRIVKLANVMRYGERRSPNRKKDIPS